MYYGVAGALLAGAAAPVAAAITPSWNGYHWARTGPLSIQLGDNVGQVWKPFLATAATQWSTANNIDFALTAGRSTANSCSAVYGTVQACSWNYGATGWLGYANVWTSNGFVVQATVKLNDYYFASGKYNTSAWRAMTTCQEVGHTLGLAHANTSKTNANLGTCMDYTNDPTGTLGSSNGFLANIAPYAGDFASLDAIYAKLDSTQLSYTKPQFVIGDGYNIGEDDHDLGVTAVPEPATWLLLVVGFGTVGTLQRRSPRVVYA